jgi:hypothetical protein|tara:strand:+ start:295 stop:453 length:159 start_codon:yes stop_codon:yes gene_type:complete
MGNATLFKFTGFIEEEQMKVETMRELKGRRWNEIFRIKREKGKIQGVEERWV